MRFRFSQKLFVCGLILLFQFICLAQSDKEKGSALYEQGLSYEKQGKTKEAIKTYEQIVNSAISRMEFEIENEYAGKSAVPGQESWTDFIRRKMGENISTAIRSIGRLKEINPKKAASPEWETRSLILETFAKRDEETTDADKQPSTSQPVKITHKSTPDYTFEARNAGAGGMIRFRVMFLTNGRVGLVIPLNRLSYGLTESAIAAARKIKFEPATRDGKPVNVFKVVEFGFFTTR